MKLRQRWQEQRLNLYFTGRAGDGAAADSASAVAVPMSSGLMERS